MTDAKAGNGVPRDAAEDRHGCSPTMVVAVSWAALQGLAAVVLVAATLLARLVLPPLMPALSDFTKTWLGAFLLVPLSFVPALLLWQPWASARHGRHPRLLRLAAELAFAGEVVVALLLWGLA